MKSSTKKYYSEKLSQKIIETNKYIDFVINSKKITKENFIKIINNSNIFIKNYNKNLDFLNQGIQINNDINSILKGLNVPSLEKNLLYILQLKIQKINTSLEKII